jgi:Holliday junction resolvase
MLKNTRDFKSALTVGDKGESVVWMWLRFLYGANLRHVSEYHPDGHRWKGIVLPDFLIKTPEEKTFIEVKMKKGWKGYLNINKSQVLDYLKIAEKAKAKLFVYFICIADGKMYSISAEKLKKPIRTERDSDNRVFFLYDKEDQEVLMEDMPTAIFNTDLLKTTG